MNYLQIPIEKIEEIEMILERCQHLSIARIPQSMKIKQWFERNTSDSIYRKSNGFDIVWIGKKNNDDQKQDNFKCKRIKISEDFMESQMSRKSSLITSS